MGLSSSRIRTARGDLVEVSRLTDGAGRSSFYLSVIDVDHSPIPCAELSNHDVVEIRESMRKLLQEAPWASAV